MARTSSGSRFVTRALTAVTLTAWLCSSPSLAAIMGETPSLVLYFSGGPGRPPRVEVVYDVLCSAAAAPLLRRQFESGPTPDPSLTIDSVEVSCPKKTITTIWAPVKGASAVHKGAKAWRDVACFRHEIFFIAQGGWKVVKQIKGDQATNMAAEATCDGFSLMSTDIARR